MRTNSARPRGGGNQLPITASMRKCLPCLWAVGFGKKAISKLTGIHELTVHRIRKRLGVVPASRSVGGSMLKRQTKKPEVWSQMRLRIELDESAKRSCKARYNYVRYWKNPEKRRRLSANSARKYWANRVSKIPQLKLKHLLRARIWKACKGIIKLGRTMELTGCNADQLKAHLESLFKPGMNWENYGAHWHVDHIKPCASFDLSDPEQQRACFHYTNLQPLEATLNKQKSDRTDWADGNGPTHPPPGKRKLSPPKPNGVTA